MAFMKGSPAITERQVHVPASEVGSAPPEKPPSTRSTRYFFHDVLGAWAWELATWGLAVGLLAAIYIILDKANNKPVDDWKFSINLNTLAATISTIFRALLVAIAAEILSQQKWIWFWSMAPARPLQHLQDFDQGSRGIWGAVCLLPTVIGRSALALLAVLIIVVSFAVGPFVQQAINTVPRQSALELGSASLPVSYAVNGNGTYFRSLGGALIGMWDIKYAARSLFYSAILDPESSNSIITPSCSTGNCTFPSWGPVPGQEDLNVTHASVGICSKCTDVTELITRHNGTIVKHRLTPTRFTLPNGMAIEAGDGKNWTFVQGYGNLSWAESVIPRDKAAYFEYAFTNITVLTMTAHGQPEDYVSPYPGTTNPTNATAASCSLYPCLRTYSAAVNEGVLLEKVVHTQPLYPNLGNNTDQNINFGVLNYSTPGMNISWSAVQSPCRVGDDIYTTANMSEAENTTTVRLLSPGASPDYPSSIVPQECVFSMDGFYTAMIGQLLGIEVFNGTCYWDPRQGNDALCAAHWWLSQFWENGNASVATISKRFSTVTDALTNQLRLGLGRDNSTQSQVEGTAFQTRSYTTVKWQWLLFPTILLVVETAVLGWMIGRSWYFQDEELVWKSNILPLLYYRDRFARADGATFMFDGSTRQADPTGSGGRLMTNRELGRDAQQTRVKFRRGRRQEGFVDNSGYSSARQYSPPPRA
ncbi:Fc.00g097500.m01.CDS01 [Cosmosporella sp. VM-42]